MEMERFCGDPARNLRVDCHRRYSRELPNALYRKRGDGTFESFSGKGGIAADLSRRMDVATVDYGGGWVDIFVPNDYLMNSPFRKSR